MRHIFARYRDLGCVRRLCAELNRSGYHTRLGKPFQRGMVYWLLANPIYIGEIRHKDKRHPGRHPPTVDRNIWDVVQHLRQGRPPEQRARKSETSWLAGKLFDDRGERLTPSHANKRGRRYRYYVSASLVTGISADSATGWRVPAETLEKGGIGRHDRGSRGSGDAGR